MRNTFITLYITIIGTLLWLSGCHQDKQSKSSAALVKRNETLDFPFILSQKTMVINEEQDNEIEGHYLKVLEVVNDTIYRVNIPANFYLRNRDISEWMIGWPTGNAYYDAGNENLAEIAKIDIEKGIVTIGRRLRGAGLPQLNKRIVFWSKSPSGYKDVVGKLIEPKWFKGFGGESIEFGSIIYDNLSHQWVMYIQEVDTEYVRIYVATSNDLIKWNPANGGQPLFTPDQFTNTTWAGLNYDGSLPQVPRFYSSVLHNGKWHFYLSGYGKAGIRQIGLITCTDPLNGPFDISTEPVLSNGINGSDVNGCFYPKVAKAGNKFIMYYDGVSWDNTETVCMAESEDLVHWTRYAQNPVIGTHYGWRNGAYTSEPNYVAYSNDTVWLMCGGYKKYNTEFTVEDSVAGRTPRDLSIFSKLETEKGKHVSGNVMDAQLGAFISIDGGYTFKPHSSNPIWINNYSDTLQNDHSGGDFFPANINGREVIIYQAKSATMNRYNILMRMRN